MRDVPILATIALVPLILTPHLLLYYDVTPKIAILLLGVCVALLVGRIDVRSLWGAPSSRWFVCIAAFQWIWFALATALSTNRPLSLNGGMWRRAGLIPETALLAFALLCLAWLGENPARVLMLRRVVTATGVLISVYTIAQYFGVDPVLPATAYLSGEGPFTIVRPPGTLGHADYLAAWLIFAAFCSRPGWLFPLPAFAIVLTGTRSALLGLLAGVVLFALWRFRAATKRERYAVAAFAGLVAAFFISPGGEKLRARVHWSRDDSRGGARLLLWRDTLPMVARHPLTGLGPETFGTQFPLYESLDLARAYPDFYHESPHNFVLDVAADQGIPAALAFLALCGLAFWSGLRSKSEAAAPLMAGLAAMVVAHQFVAFTVPTELALYVLIVMLISLDESGAVVYVPKFWPAAAVARYAIAGVLLVFTVRLVTADFLMGRAEADITRRDAAGASKAYQASLRWQPAGTGADLSYSRQMTSLSFEQAFESGMRATEQSEQRQNAWYNMAQLFAVLNDAASTERCLRNAIAWSPTWFKPHWILAQLLKTQNRSQEALLEARAAVERDGCRHAEVSDFASR